MGHIAQLSDLGPFSAVMILKEFSSFLKTDSVVLEKIILCKTFTPFYWSCPIHARYDLIEFGSTLYQEAFR